MMKPSTRRCGKILINIVIAVIGFLLIIFLLPKTLVFFMPFVIGWLIACIASPVVRFLEEKLKIRRKAVTAIVIVVAIALVVLAGYGIVMILSEQFVGFVEYLPMVWKSFESDMMDIARNLGAIFSKLPQDIQLEFQNIGADMQGYITDIMGGLGTPTIAAVGSFAKNIPSVVIGVIMCALSAYFFISEKEYVNNFFRVHTPVALQKRWHMVFGNLKKAVGGYFKAQFKIEIWIYLLLVIGLVILDIDYAFLIAFGMALLDILPFFGTGIVLIPWAIVKFLSADYKMFIGLLVIWGVGQLVRQIIQPKIVGDSIGVAPIPTLLFLFIGYKVAGMMGMIVAVPIGIIIIRLNEDGVFDNVKNNIKLFIKTINEFRRLNAEDLKYLEEDRNKEDESDSL